MNPEPMNHEPSAANVAIPGDPPLGLRERKKDDTRRALIEAAYRLTLDRGFAGFTVAEIADAVGVSRRTFSNYFGGKAECVIAANELHADQAIAELRGGDPAEPVDQLIRRLVRMATADADGPWGDFAQIVSSEPELRGEAAVFDQRVALQVADAVAERLGIPADDVVAQALGMFAMTSCRLVVEQWLRRGRPDGRDGLTALLERVFLLLDPTALDSLKYHPGN